MCRLAPEERELGRASNLETRQVAGGAGKVAGSEGDAKEKVLHGICRMCMQGDCLTLVHIKDGVVTRVEGRPNAPPNFGNLCPRGNSAVMNLYNPYRIKSPMKRTNPEKGLDVDPGWVEISWEEALELVAQRFKEVREKDARGLVVCEGWGNRESILRVPFEKAFGTPNEVGSHGVLCTVHLGTDLVHSNFPISVVDLQYCQYHITLGRSIGPNFATTGGIRKFAQALDRGMKLVVVDPRCSPEASKGEWVPIRPGTDLAFLLAMAHVMFYEIEKYDEWFLKNRTNAPYLIDEAGEYVRDKVSGAPLMWDPEEGRAKPWNSEFKDVALRGEYVVDGKKCEPAFEAVRRGFASYTPEWQEPITTVPAETVRRIAREFVEAAQIGSTILIDGTEFPFRPVSLNCERNVMNHRGGTYADLVGKIINMLVGAIEVPGSCLGCGKRGPVLKPGDDGTVEPSYEAVGIPFTFPPLHADMAEFYPHRHTTPQMVAKAILEPEKYHLSYEIGAWLTIGANPIKMVAQPQVFVEALKKVPFVVTIGYHIDEMAIMSDVVLPEHSFLERLRVAVFWPEHQAVSGETNSVKMICMRQPVPPLYNTKHVDEILMEIADRMGILLGPGGVYDQLNQLTDHIVGDEGLVLKDPYKLDINRRYSIEEIYDNLVKSWIGDGRGLEYLSEVGYHGCQLSRKYGYNYYYFPENKTRHPFYFYRLKKSGEKLRDGLRKYGISFPGVKDEEHIFELYKPIPVWVENSELRAPEEYDMFAINFKTPFFSSSVGDPQGNPWLRELTKDDPYEERVWINSETAKRKGLRDGDLVRIESRYGWTLGIIKVTELIHPEVVGIPGGYGPGTVQSNPRHREGPHFNSLLSVDDETFDGISCGIELAPRVKVVKIRQ